MAPLWTLLLAGLAWSTARAAGCPERMALVDSGRLRFCIDRWENIVADRNTGLRLSPYYTPSPAKGWPGAAWQHKIWSAKPKANYPMPDLPTIEQTGAFEPMAVTEDGVYPQGFMNRALAERACRGARKRLCSRQEWYTACVGPGGPAPASGSYPVAFPYGLAYEKGRCNFQVVAGHPLLIVGRSSSELDDPRLMLAEKGGQRLLAATGAFKDCASAYGVYDMVGNQDEVVSDMSGQNMVFVGSFYSRDQKGRPLGCASAISAHHASSYLDYSIGFRCCLDPDG